MNKLFLADIFLVLTTFIGGVYLEQTGEYNLNFLIFIFLFYTLSKIIGYIILPYKSFQRFIDNLTESSRMGRISGYELFKSSLVALLYFGSLFLHPGLWIIESILVILMRVWGKMYIRRLKNL